MVYITRGRARISEAEDDPRLLVIAGGHPRMLRGIPAERPSCRNHLPTQIRVPPSPAASWDVPFLVFLTREDDVKAPHPIFYQSRWSKPRSRAAVHGERPS